MKGLRLICLIVIPVSVAYGQQMSSDGCYEVYPNSKVNCMQSYKGQGVASEQQCRDLCTQDAGQCKSAMYTQATQHCDLYNSFLPVGQPGRKKREADSVEGLEWLYRFRRGSYLGTGQGYRPTYVGGSPSYPAPAPSYHPKPSYQPPPAPSYRPQPQPQPYRPQPSYQPKPTYGGGGQGYASCGGYGPTVQSVTGCTYCRPTGTCLGAQTTLPPAPVTTPTPAAACPAGQVLRYYKAEQFKIQGSPDATFAADSEQACLTACTNNQQPTGAAAMCKSADYDSQNKQCLVFSSQAFPPQGSASPTADQAFVHYEKICVDAALGNRCPGPFILAPQRILIGYAQTVTTASNMADCLNLCANSQSRFGFACQSGMFYFQEGTNNCILNSESKNTHPDVFQQETQDQVSYFETTCPAARSTRASLSQTRNRNVLQLDTPDFASWTLCDRMVLDHKRFKQCSTLNPNKCSKDQNICDPKKEDEYDLQIVQPVKHFPNNSVTPPPVRDDAGRLVTKNITKESAFSQVQARSSGHSQSQSPTGPVLPPGKCFPLVNLDGSKDCQHGTMFSASGKRSDCVPSFADCIG